MLTVLTMTTQSAAATSQLQHVSYIKAVDVWFSTYLIFVFASLLEFAVTHEFLREGIHHKGRHYFRKPSAGPDELTVQNDQEQVKVLDTSFIYTGYSQWTFWTALPLTALTKNYVIYHRVCLSVIKFVSNSSLFIKGLKIQDGCQPWSLNVVMIKKVCYIIDYFETNIIDKSMT